jgi:3-hydroxyisobutyrate dehydrogenase-like beta-hydroxyacid dehydrogenase
VNVGFIGLGRMGSPMARCLQRAGFPLTVYNRTRRRALLLGDAGAAADQMLTVARASEGEDADFAMVAAALRGIARTSEEARQ